MIDCNQCKNYKLVLNTGVYHQPLKASFNKSNNLSLQVDDIFDDGSCHSQQRFQPLNSVTQVYRAETSTSQLQQQLHQQQQQRPSPQLQRPTSLLPPPLEKSEILLGAILRTSERNRHLEEELESVETFEPRRFDDDLLNRVMTPKSGQQSLIDSAVQIREESSRQLRDDHSRLRSRSENISVSSTDTSLLDPFDVSFEDEKSFEERSDWIAHWKRNGQFIHSPGNFLFK